MSDALSSRTLPTLDDAAFRLMAENINDLIALYDGEGRFLYANPAWRHTLGYDPALLVGRARVEIIHPDDAPRYRRHADMATTLGGIPLDELQVRHRDGSWRTVESSGRVMRDAQGRPEREVLLWRDITERRRAELLLFDQKRALEAMASGVPLAEVLRTVAAIPESRLPGVWCAIFTRDRRAGRLRLACVPNLPTAMVEALSDLPLDSGFESWGTGGLPVPALPDRPLPPEALEVRQAALANRIASAWSWPVAAPKSEPIGTLVLYAAQITPPSREIREVAEATAHLACTALTAHRAEEGSRQEHSRLVAQLDGWPHPTMEVDADGRLTWWSRQAERALGWRSSDVEGRALVELPVLTPEARKRTQQALAALAAPGAPAQRWPAQVRIRDGSYREMEGEASALRDDQGQLQAVLVQLRDISAQVEAQAAQRQAAHLGDSRGFAQGAAQMFGTLVRAAMRSASRVRREQPAPTQNAEILESRLRELLDRSAQLALWAGDDTTTGAPLNLNEVARDAMSHLVPQLPTRISLDSYLDPDLPPAMGSRAELEMVVAQLLLNAAEAIGEERGFVRLTTDLAELNADDLRALGNPPGMTPGSYALIEVTDTGPGAPAEVLERATEPFFSTRGTGRGLGLAAAEGIVRSQGGTLRLRCQPGHGVSAQVYLPVDRPRAPRSGVVLVVSKDPSVVADVSRALRAAGLEVDVATSAAQSAERLRPGRAPVAAVLVDSVLPAPGLEAVVEQARALDRAVPLLRLGDPDPELNLPSIDPEVPAPRLVARVKELLGGHAP